MSHVNKSAGKFETDFIKVQEKYAGIIQGIGQLMIDLLPPPATQQTQTGVPIQTFRPVDALEPGFTSSFDHSPTEVAAWMAQFKA